VTSSFSLYIYVLVLLCHVNVFSWLIYNRHNRNLGHTSERGVELVDTSSVMGRIINGTTLQCYNGPDYDSLTWMKDRTRVVNTTNGASTVELAFFGDYPLTTPKQPTLVIANGIYLQYNLQRGINAQTHKYENQVLVHIRRAGLQGTSFMRALNETSPSYTLRRYNVTVRFCFRRIGVDRKTPNSVMMAVGPVGSDLIKECLSVKNLGKLFSFLNIISALIT
jgi:hypothetical protein